WKSAHGTPEDQYHGVDEQIALDQKNLQDRNDRREISNAEWAAGQTAIEARKTAAAAARKSAEEYRSQVESFQKDIGGRWREAAPVDAADTLKQLTEL